MSCQSRRPSGSSRTRNGRRGPSSPRSRAALRFRRAGGRWREGCGRGWRLATSGGSKLDAGTVVGPINRSLERGVESVAAARCSVTRSHWLGSQCGYSGPMGAARNLPEGPRAPRAWQSLGWQKRPIPYLERCRAKYGKTFTLRLLGIDPFVMMSRPEDVKAIFTAPPEVLHPGEGARDPAARGRAELDPAPRRGAAHDPAQADAARPSTARRWRRCAASSPRSPSSEVESWTTGIAGSAPPLHAGADDGGDPSRGLRPRAGRAPRAAPRICSAACSGSG